MKNNLFKKIIILINIRIFMSVKKKKKQKGAYGEVVSNLAVEDSCHPLFTHLNPDGDDQ